MQTSDKKHWDDFWASSQNLEEVYANDDRIVDNLRGHVDFAGLRVLEVGAGTGRDSAAIAALGAEVWTLDYSEESLQLMAQNLGDAVTIVCGDALALPFADESFDLVFHQGLLEHFRNPQDLLAENHRILKPGGHLLVDVPQRFHYYTLAKHVLMFLDKWFAGWETEFSPKELEHMMAERGFDIVDTYGHNLYPPIWYRGARKILRRVGLRLPMHPLSSRFVDRVRGAFRKVVPRDVWLNAAMVVGCIGKKN